MSFSEHFVLNFMFLHVIFKLTCFDFFSPYLQKAAKCSQFRLNTLYESDFPTISLAILTICHGPKGLDYLNKKGYDKKIRRNQTKGNKS